MWRVYDSGPTFPGQGFLIEDGAREHYPPVGKGLLPLAALYILVDMFNIRDYGEVAPFTQESKP